MKKKRNKPQKARHKSTQHVSNEETPEIDSSEVDLEMQSSMSEHTAPFVITGFSKGVLSGLLRGSNLDPSQVELKVHGECVGRFEPVETTEFGVYEVTVPIDGAVLEHGSNVFLLTDKRTEEVLGRFNVKCGDTFDDVRQEVASLRAELDLLKGSFRSHVRQGA